MISTTLTDAREGAPVLEHVLYIYYLVQFKKDKTLVQALINSRIEVNAIHPTFIKELGLPIRSTDVEVQKIDRIRLDTYRMVVTAFLMMDKANYVRFFKETFLVANVSLEIVLEMLFITFSSVNINFLDWKIR